MTIKAKLLALAVLLALFVGTDEDLQADTQTTDCVRELRTNIYRWQAWYRSTE